MPRSRQPRGPFGHRVVLRQTAFRAASDAKPGLQELYGALARNEERNDLIFDDILAALETKRSPVVITERKDHLASLAKRLSRFARNVIVLRGSTPATAFGVRTSARLPLASYAYSVVTNRLEGRPAQRVMTVAVKHRRTWQRVAVIATRPFGVS